MLATGWYAQCDHGSYETLIQDQMVMLKEVILTGIGDEIYSTVDACQTAQNVGSHREFQQGGIWLSLQIDFKKLFYLPTTTSELPQTPETGMWIQNPRSRWTFRWTVWDQRVVNDVGARETVGGQ
ncbi:hypothetical protein Tco_0680041 [Tanacetum coccineum]|uniref:Uncharacterized protein n=1 Tax=Tanacetum coccineum TaxID=301880 RepID=A0ABQ4XJK2_9ASTR